MKENELKKHYIKLIQTLKHNYFIDDECRKVYLMAEFGKDSLTKLNIDELRKVLEVVGYTPYSKKRMKDSIKEPKSLDKRAKASSSQIAMIYAIWAKISREKSELSLRNFIFRILKKRPMFLGYLSKTEASKIIVILENMEYKENMKELEVKTSKAKVCKKAKTKEA